MINPLFFFIGLFIGFFIIYINSPIPEIIIQYPTPKNAGNIVYKDKDDVCYKYKAKKRILWIKGLFFTTISLYLFLYFFKYIGGVPGDTIKGVLQDTTQCPLGHLSSVF